MAAAISVGSNNSSNPGATGSNMYRVGDYVYFEAQPQQSVHHQQQPFQIRRIEELNKTAGGNVEAKVMCFYRRRDLPAQLIALADKHHQQQLALTLALSPSSALKSVGKLTASGKSIEKDSVVDMKEQDTTSPIMKKKSKEGEQTDSNAEVTPILKEEQRLDGADMEGKTENNISVLNIHKSGEGNDSNLNNEASDTGKDEDKIVHSALQQQNDWWRSEQLKQRELFLSRQVETMAATHIRGKCTVTLYNETESLDSYLEKDDTFFYCLVFDPVQKTLLADKGEIRVGHKYQAEVPPKAPCNSNDLKTKDNIKSELMKKECLIDGEEPMMTDSIQDEDNKVCVSKASTTITTVTSIGTSIALESDSDLETLVWTCRPQWNHLSDRQIDQFLVVSRSLGTFARALDCTSSVKQPSLHMSAAAASRDITLFHAMDTLHRHGYDLGSATCSLVPSTGPVLCRDEMEEWSASEANLFEEALEKYGKDFGDIRHDFLPWKTHKNIVEYYYMWKTTDRYVQQKRVKAVEQESKLKQVYIPSYNTPNSGKQQAITSKSSQHQLLNGNSAIELYSSKNNSVLSDGQLLLPGACDLCDAVVSQQWFPNTVGVISGQTPISYHQQNGGSSSAVSSTLCFECWNHWKKYGGPRTASSDKKVLTAVRGGSVSGDDDRPHSNASSSSTAINMNARPSSHPPSMMNSPHHQQLLNVSGHHNTYQQQQPSASSTTGSGSHLLHQPHINSSSISTTNHKCTIIGCMSAPFKSKSQLLRHYNSTHGIGINSNNNSPSTIMSLTNNKSSNADGGCNDMLSPAQSQLQQQISSNSGLYNNAGGPLNLNSSNNSVQLSNSTGGTVNQVINYVASSSSPQPQPNNLSMSGVASNNALGTGVAMTASGRPIMKTRTAFYLRSTSLAKASRRRAAQQAAIALFQQQQHKKKSGGTVAPSAALLQPGCLARPRNVARRPFVCVPQTAHSYKHECMLSMQHAPVHELRAYLRAAAVKAHARRPGVTRVANALIAARRGRSGNSAAIAADLAVPDWLSLPSQQQHQSSHHHVSSSSKHGKQSSRSSNGGRVAFPKPPKAPDGSLLYERVPNKQEAVASGATNVVLNNSTVASAASAVGLNPVTAAAILGALGPPGPVVNNSNTSTSSSSNDPVATGFDIPAAVLYQSPSSSSSSSNSNKRRLYETEGGSSGRKQPQPQVGPPSKRMHRQHHSQQLQPTTSGHHQTQLQQPMPTSAQGAGGAVDGMLASIVAHQQQQQQRSNLGSGGPLQLTTGSGNSNKSSGLAGHQQMQQHNHYRTPSMARTGRKHVISWTDAPDDLYYRCTSLSRSLRKARMTGKELRRSARKPWKPIAALLGISFAMPPNNAVTSSVAPQVSGMSLVVQNAQQPGVSLTPSNADAGAPYDMTTTSNRKSPSVMQPNQSSAVPSHVSGAPVISSCSGSGVSSHH